MSLPQIPAPLTIHATGPQLIDVRLEPVLHLRERNGMEEDYRGPFLAAVIHGGDFDGSPRFDAGSRFEVNAFAPDGFEDRDGDACLLASIEFHHVALTSARKGVFRFTGILTQASLYPAGIYERIAAGEDIGSITEIANDENGLRIAYLPPSAGALEPFFGWSASITVRPLPKKAGE